MAHLFFSKSHTDNSHEIHAYMQTLRLHLPFSCVHIISSLHNVINTSSTHFDNQCFPRVTVGDTHMSRERFEGNAFDSAVTIFNNLKHKILNIIDIRFKAEKQMHTNVFVIKPRNGSHLQAYKSNDEAFFQNYISVTKP